MEMVSLPIGERSPFPADMGPKDAMQKVSQYLSGVFEINERDLLTRTGAMERDFRWLRGDGHMYFTTTPHDHDALPPAHQYHRTGITFRLLGDPAFLFAVFYLIGLSLYVEQAYMANAILAASLLGFVMIGVAGQGLFLYPTIYDVLRATMVQHSPASLQKTIRWGVSAGKMLVNFLSFFESGLEYPNVFGYFSQEGFLCPAVHQGGT